MRGKAKKFRKINESINRDRISDLPADVITNILCFLPLRDAVRTCTLSTKWRHTWKNLPQLVFDNETFNRRYLGLDCYNLVPLVTPKLLLAINRILVLHEGGITKFTLPSFCLKNIPESEFDTVMLHLSRKHVEDLTLKFTHNYKLPWSLFSCLRLRHLHLSFCVFTLPQGFAGFRSLVTLNLSDVDFDAKSLETFIRSCPLLKELGLSCSYVKHMKIEACRLQVFDLDCLEIGSICFKNTPLLARVSITVGEIMAEEHKLGVGSNAVEVFGSLPALERLDVDGGEFLQFFALGGLPRRLPTILYHLTAIRIGDMSFCAVDEVSCLLCLIRSSPNLRKLDIDITAYRVDPDQGKLGAKDYEDFSIDQLQEVGIYGVVRDHEMDFIQVILAEAPVLRTLNVRPNECTTEAGRLEILEKLTRFPRASKAKVIYWEPSCRDVTRYI